MNDLIADDFEVTDANKPQKIVFFRHKDSTQWQVPSPAPNQFSNRSSSSVSRATVILFDLMNEAFSTRGTAATQIVKCLQNLDSAHDVYFYLLTLDGRLFAVHGLPGGEEGAAEGAPWNKTVRPLMDKALRDVLRMRPVDVDVAIRVQLTFAALDALGVQLSRVPGRKNVVWVTDGVPITLGPVRSDIGEAVDFTPELRKLSEGLVRSGIALYPVRQLLIGTPDDIGGTSGGAGATHPDELEGAAGGTHGGARNQTGPTDTAGVGTQSLSTLNLLAQMTGGRPSSGKDTCAALKQARSDERVSYQIGYYTPESNWDGKYHKLKVTCKRKRVRIQAKTGYFAWVDEPGSGSEQAIHSVLSTEFDAAEIGLLSTLTADPKDKHAADLTARIDARDIALAQEGDHYNGQLRLALAGYLADGRTEISKIIPLDLHFTVAERDKALSEGIRVSQSLPIAEQLRKVRLIVYDRGSNAIGSLTMPVNAPNP